MARNKKARSGTWLTRELILSKAYWALNKHAKGILLLFMLKRDISKQHVCKNCKELTMTYLELENLHKNHDGSTSGVPRASISRGLVDLMAKGFIELVRLGGAYQKDKSIYGLCDDWKRWNPGDVIRAKEKGKQVGHCGRNKNLNAQNDTHTRPQNETLNLNLGFQNDTHVKDAKHENSVT